jgi:hypothetical protein
MSSRAFIALSKVSGYGSSGCFRLTKWKESNDKAVVDLDLCFFANGQAPETPVFGT